MDVAATATEVRQVLEALKWAQVVAVWPDARVTIEDFAFERRHRLDGPRSLPLTSFVAGPNLPTVEEIVARLERALAHHVRRREFFG